MLWQSYLHRAIQAASGVRWHMEQPCPCLFSERKCFPRQRRKPFPPPRSDTDAANHVTCCPQPPQSTRLNSLPRPIVETCLPATRAGAAFASVYPKWLVTVMMHALVLPVWGASSPHQTPDHHNFFRVFNIDDPRHQGLTAGL